MIGPGAKDTHVTPPSHREHARKANPVVVGRAFRGTSSRRGDDLAVTWLDDRPPPTAAIEEEAGRLADTELKLEIGWSSRASEGFSTGVDRR